MWWHGYERKETECWCQVKEFLSAASDRSLRRTGTQTGLLLATGALAAGSLDARDTYMWVYVWVCVFVSPVPVCSNPDPNFTSVELLFLSLCEHNVAGLRHVIMGFVSAGSGFQCVFPLPVCRCQRVSMCVLSLQICQCLSHDRLPSLQVEESSRGALSRGGLFFS